MLQETGRDMFFGGRFPCPSPSQLTPIHILRMYGCVAMGMLLFFLVILLFHYFFRALGIVLMDGSMRFILVYLFWLSKVSDVYCFHLSYIPHPAIKVVIASEAKQSPSFREIATHLSGTRNDRLH